MFEYVIREVLRFASPVQSSPLINPGRVLSSIPIWRGGGCAHSLVH